MEFDTEDQVLFYFSFIINLLLVNLLSNLFFLPLVSMNLILSPVSLPGQCLISEAVSHLIANLSLLSTLLIAVDQYLAIIHALRYHHYMTRTRSTVSFTIIWVISILLTIITVAFEHSNYHLWTSCKQTHDTRLLSAILSCSIAMTRFVSPIILIFIIYSKVYLQAHNSSERVRKCSLNPSESVSTCLIIPSDSISSRLNPAESRSTMMIKSQPIETNLSSSESIMRNSVESLASTNLFESFNPGLNKFESFRTKLNPSDSVSNRDSQVIKVPRLIYSDPVVQGGIRRFSISTCAPKEEIQNRRKSSLPASSVSDQESRITNTGQQVRREEERTAKIYILSMTLILCSWTPFCVSSFVNQLLPFPPSSWSSFLILYLSLLYAPISPFIFAIRNRKVRREVLNLIRRRSGGASWSITFPRIFNNLPLTDSDRQNKAWIPESSEPTK